LRNATGEFVPAAGTLPRLVLDRGGPPSAHRPSRAAARPGAADRRRAHAAGEQAVPPLRAPSAGDTGGGGAARATCAS